MLAQAISLGLSEEWFDKTTPFLSLKVMLEVADLKFGKTEKAKPQKRKATASEVANFIK